MTTHNNDDHRPNNDDEDHNDDALYVSVKKRRWSRCRSLLRRDDASRFARYTFVDGNDALFEACTHRCPIDVVEMIHIANPASISRRNGDGSTPLHLASSSASEAVVTFLIETAPHVVVVADADGWTPLHSMVWSRAITMSRCFSSSTVERVLSISPTAARARDVHGDTPLTVFARRWATAHKEHRARTLFALLSSYSNGGLPSSRPLHDALRYGPGLSIPSRALRDCIVEATRADCARPDARGDFPLHSECARRCNSYAG